ncbi:antibiotic biosynthesis monooxygenase family protein [Jatrophihabitans sp. DSM 45814]
MELWRSDRDAAEVLMVTRWRDREAFTAYMKSSDHRVSHARMSASLKAAITPFVTAGRPRAITRSRRPGHRGLRAVSA